MLSSLGRRSGRILLGVCVLLFLYSGIKARHLSSEFVSPFRGLLPKIAVAAVLVGAILLNAGWLGRVWERHRHNEHTRARVFYASFAGILVLAVLCRIVWTRSELFPGTTPDGYTYLLPALEHPKLPLSEARPFSFPYLISFSLALFGHPVGILIVHNLLAVVSAAVLSLAVRRRLEMPVVSLVLIFYMLFCAKNVAFEYLLLTEHLSRCVFALTLGLLLWVKKPGPLLAGLLAVLTLVAVLAKPNALVLIPGVLAAFVTGQWLTHESWRRILKVSCVYTGVVTLGLGGYMTLQRARFGSFQITAMTGYALYWNVNLLTDLNGPAHPEVKRELRTFFPRYVEKYGRQNQNLGDWAIWGSSTPEIERDFGKQSPGAVVRAYAMKHGSGSPFRRIDRVFMDLAIEGIRAHPWKYVEMSLRSTVELVWYGLSFSYFGRATVVPQDVATRAEFFRLWSIVGHARSEHLVVPRGFRPSNPRSPALLLPEAFSRLWGMWFYPMVLASAALLGFVGWKGGIDALGRRRLLLLVPSAVTIGCYLVLCGFVVTGEPPRYLLPIQDLIVTLVLCAFATAASSILRASAKEEVLARRQKEALSQPHS